MDQVVERINQIQLSSEDNERNTLLMQLQEFVVHQAPHLLKDSLPLVLELQVNRNVDFRKTLVNFIGEALGKLAESSNVALESLAFLIQDNQVNVIKAVLAVLSASAPSLVWYVLLISSDSDTAKSLGVLTEALVSKRTIDNDSLKSALIKYLQTLTVRSKGKNGVSYLEILLSFLRDPNFSVSQVSIILNMVVSTIKENDSFIPVVVPALLDLHENPPPNLSPTQMKSLMHGLKLQLGNVIKLPQASHFVQIIRDVLSDVDQEKKKKRAAVEESEISAGKRAKILEAPATADTAASAALGGKTRSEPKIEAAMISQIDVTLLPLTHVIDTIFSVLRTVPFSELESCLHKWKDTGVAAAAMRTRDPRFRSGPAASDVASAQSATGNQFLLECLDLGLEANRDLLRACMKRLLRGEHMATRFGIRSIWRENICRLLYLIYHQDSENESLEAAEFGYSVFSDVLDFVFEDFKSRFDLAVSLLFKEWQHDLTLLPSLSEEELEEVERYPQAFEEILGRLSGSPDSKTKVLTSFLLNCPYLEETQVMTLLRDFCLDEERLDVGVSTLKDFVLYRKPLRQPSLSMLLNFSAVVEANVRKRAVSVVQDSLLDVADISSIIFSFALDQLGALESVRPPSGDEPAENEPDSAVAEEEDLLFDPHERLANEDSGWTEAAVSQYLDLQLAVVERKPEHFERCGQYYFRLTEHYSRWSGRVQKITRRKLRPVVEYWMEHSKDFVKGLFEKVNPNNERLVLRVLVVVCEAGRPSDDFISAVVQAYKKGAFKATFLVPLLHWFDKQQVLNFIPDFVDLCGSSDDEKKLFKEILSKLLDPACPVTPLELFIALHTVPENLIKKAMEPIFMCLAMPHIFKPDLIANSLDKMSEMQFLPMLLLRTVIQSVSLYRSLSTFVLTLLQRLASRRIWQIPRLWEGFIRCCKMLYPGSYQIIAHLPSAQIQDMFSKLPEMKASFRSWFSEQQPSFRQRFPNVSSILK